MLVRRGISTRACALDKDYEMPEFHIFVVEAYQEQPMDEVVGDEECRSVSNRGHSLTSDDMDKDTSTGAESTTELDSSIRDSNKEKSR